MIFQLQKNVTNLGAGKEAYCTKKSAGKEAYCTKRVAGKEAYCTKWCEKRILMDTGHLGCPPESGRGVGVRGQSDLFGKGEGTNQLKTRPM